MEILHPNFSPDADLPERFTDLSRLLIITDRPGYATAAESAGISCVSVHSGKMKLDWDGLLTGVETLIVACGSGISPSYNEVLMYAQNSTRLLRAAVAATQVTHLILLEEDDDVFTSVLDGMSLSVAAEEKLMTSVVRVDGTVDSERLVMWIASAARQPGGHLQSIGCTVNRVQLRSIRLSTEYDAVSSGDVVVLVGGSGGIGRKVCRHLAQRGARVVVIGRSKPDPYIAGALRDAGSTIYLRIDPNQSDAIDQALRYVHALSLIHI